MRSWSFSAVYHFLKQLESYTVGATVKVFSTTGVIFVMRALHPKTPQIFVTSPKTDVHQRPKIASNMLSYVFGPIEHE